MKIFASILALALLPSACTQSDNASPAAAGPQRVAVKVTDAGYEPAEVKVPHGQPVTLVFTRTSESMCGSKVVIPAQNIERDLPLNQPVEVSITASQAGSIAFACGMDMMKGTIIVQ